MVVCAMPAVGNAAVANTPVAKAKIAVLMLVKRSSFFVCAICEPVAYDEVGLLG
jgi:hypothetical protein